MCGIAGIINFAGEPPAVEDIRCMSDSIRHRGPDDEGFLVDGRVALGNRRLSIIDLSPRGRQPIFNEDGSIGIVYNGEIYNHAGIRGELESLGHIFGSNTDTEVVVHAYEQWGIACVDRFNGMWGFAILDRRKRIVFLSRDRFGVKPLYYYRDSGRLLFCSEIKGILTQNIDWAPDERVIFEFLVYHSLDHTERTFFGGILRVPPGHNMVIDLESGKQVVTRWYSLSAHSRDGADVDNLRQIFEDSVQARLVSDVPVGSCLSGGIDSSSIVCMMRRLSANGNIRTFSAVFPGTKIDEGRYAREVIQQTGSEGFFVTPTAGELLQDLPDFVRTQEEPITGTSAYAQYRVMKLAHENGMKVLLDGQGSDEIFAGYDRYFGAYYRELLGTGRWATFMREAARYYGYTKKLIPFQVLVYSLLPRILNVPLRRRWFAPWINPAFYAQHARLADPERQLRSCKNLNEYLAESVSCSSIPQLLRFEDKNAMRWSVESRVPFLDYRLVEFALSLPSNRKIRDGVTKHSFRLAMKGLLPDTVLDRTDKIGFATPEDVWMNDSRVLSFLQDTFASASFRSRGYWDAGRLSQIVGKAPRERRPYAQQVWKVVFLELWFQEFVRGRDASCRSGRAETERRPIQ